MAKIRNLIRSISSNSQYFDKKYPKMKLNSHDNLPVNKTELYNMIIVVRSVSHEGDKYYSQVF